MKRFTTPVQFGDVASPFNVYVGEPCANRHPLRYQMSWLARKRGGVMPPQVVESFEKLHAIALENQVSFEELCVYALANAPKPDEITTADE